MLPKFGLPGGGATGIMAAYKSLQNLLGGSIPSSNFAMMFDTQSVSLPSYIQSIQGGFAKANVVSELMGTDNYRVKQALTREIEPITAEIGMSGAFDMLQWIADSAAKEPSRRSGRIVQLGFNGGIQFDQEFMDALLMEATFPLLSGDGKGSPYLKVKFLPERIEAVNPHSILPGWRSPGSMLQKAWTNNNFRFGLDPWPFFYKVARIEPFTIRQTVQSLYTGPELYPEIEATAIEYPDISFTIDLALAEPIISWYEDTIKDGECEEKSGTIQYVGQDGFSVNMVVNLYDVGLKSISTTVSDANDGGFKRLKVDLYVGRMDITGLTAAL